MPRGVKVLTDPRDAEIRYLRGIIDLYQVRIADLNAIVEKSTGFKPSDVVPMTEVVPETEEPKKESAPRAARPGARRKNPSGDGRRKRKPANQQHATMH